MFKRCIALFFLLTAQNCLADTQTGESIYQSTCAACHGADANGIESLSTPMLRGQHASYLKRQLKNFGNGVRNKSPHAKTMQGIAESLTDEQITLVTTFLSGLELTLQTSPSEMDPLFSEKGCNTCHGSDGRSTPSGLAPSIAGQNSWYVERQFQDFRSGMRGYHKSDLYGRTMRPQAEALKDSEIKALAEIVNSL